MTSAIEAVNVTKVYRRYARKKQFATLKSALLSGSLVSELQPDETFPALRGVSFSVPKGCTYGVIGRNGSGKSTLLKCVAGITRPTTGSVVVDGRISALIELGAGFHPEISGRENVFINGIMLGLSKREIQKRFDEIVEFAELKDFIDAPVKTYSSGMYMRLGFAVAIHVDPDVLLVDEVLAVGDQGFTVKCLDKFAEFRRRNKTILLVTHSLDLVEKFCDQALWLDKGRNHGEGDPKRVVAAYIVDVEKAEEQLLAKEEAARVAQAEAVVARDEDSPQPQNPVETADAPADMFAATEGRWGSREVEVTAVTLVGADGAAGPRLPHRRSAHRANRLPRAPADARLRVRPRHLQRRRRVLLRHQHQPRGSRAGSAERRRRGALRHRPARPGRGHLQVRRRGPQARRLPLRLPPSALHHPREGPAEGRRHLPAAASLGVHGGRQVQRLAARG